MRPPAGVGDAVDGVHHILLRLVGVQVERDGGHVAEDESTEACRAVDHGVLVDDAVHEPFYLPESFPADAAGRVDHEHDVGLAAAVCADTMNRVKREHSRR